MTSAWEWISTFLSPASPFRVSNTFSNTLAILPILFFQLRAPRVRAICCHEHEKTKKVPPFTDKFSVTARLGVLGRKTTRRDR